MPVQVNDVFKAESKSASNILCQGTEGFYIPAYQRAYAWSEGNIQRLFEDIAHGLRVSLQEKDGTFTFIGSIILISDQTKQTIQPIVQGQTPSVQLVIDGQQRLTTLVLVCVELHRELTKIAKQCSRDPDDSTTQWLDVQHNALKERLRHAFQIDMVNGGHPHRYYPRVIRAFDDQWSWVPGHAMYKSPAAAHTAARILQAWEEDGRPGAPTPPRRKKTDAPTAQSSDVTASYKAPKELERPLKAIRSFINAMSSAGETALDDDESEASGRDSKRALLDECIVNEELSRLGPAIKNLFGSDNVPESLLESLRISDKKAAKHISWLRLLLFSRYLLERVALTVVRPTNEDMAFDVFESLNTTGEPLNAVETFKPRAIIMEGIGEYERSRTKEHFALIDAYINGGKDPAARTKLVNTLLISYALSESGQSIGKHLGEQRLYLKKTFESLAEQKKQRAFVGALASMAEFLTAVWNDRGTEGNPPGALPATSRGELRKEASVALSALQLASHAITIAPLFRFYFEMKRAPEDQKATREADFLEAIRACAAFHVLWRSTRIGTKQIDSKYRALMRGSDAVPGIARQLQRSALSLADFRRALRETLANSDEFPIRAKADFVELAASTPIYDNMAPSSQRLLLMAAFQRTIHDTASNEGLPKRERSGRDVWDWKFWRANATVEHIAPRSKGSSSGYDPALYEGKEPFNWLGNLTVLPQGLNASLGNRSWEQKRALYAALSSPTDNGVIEAVRAINPSATTEDLVGRSEYIGVLEPLGKSNLEMWSLEAVKARGRRLAELAWDELRPWLDFPREH